MLEDDGHTPIMLQVLAHVPHLDLVRTQDKAPVRVHRWNNARRRIDGSIEIDPHQDTTRHWHYSILPIPFPPININRIIAQEDREVWLRAVIVGLFGRRCDFRTDFIKVRPFCVQLRSLHMGAYMHLYAWMHASSSRRLTHPPTRPVSLQRRGRAPVHLLDASGGGGRAQRHPVQAGALPRVAPRLFPPAPPDHRARL